MSIVRCRSALTVVVGALAFGAGLTTAGAGTAANSAEQRNPPLEPVTTLLHHGWCSRGGDRVSRIDFDGDGVDDVVCQTAGGDISVLLLRGDRVQPAGDRSDGLLLRRWCRAVDARLVWLDLDGTNPAVAICLRRNGTHAAMHSTGTSLEPAGQGRDGRLIDHWCPNADVSATVSARPADRRVELRCPGVDGVIRLPLPALRRPVVDNGYELRAMSKAGTWTEQVSSYLSASAGTLLPAARQGPTLATVDRTAVVEHEGTGTYPRMLGISFLLLALAAIPAVRRRRQGLRSTAAVVILLGFASAYPERIAQTAVEAEELSSWPVRPSAVLVADVAPTSWLAEQGLSPQDR